LLDALLSHLKATGDSLSSEQLAAISQCLTTEVMGSLFVMGAAPDHAMSKLRKAKITPEGAGPTIANSLANVFVRTEATKRIAALRSVGLVAQVNLRKRLENLSKDNLALVKALSAERLSA
jgi:hypothetical protein